MGMPRGSHHAAWPCSGCKTVCGLRGGQARSSRESLPTSKLQLVRRKSWCIISQLPGSWWDTSGVGSAELLRGSPAGLTPLMLSSSTHPNLINVIFSIGFPPFLDSITMLFGDRFPNKLFTPKSSSQGLLSGESNVTQIL